MDSVRPAVAETESPPGPLLAAGFVRGLNHKDTGEAKLAATSGATVHPSDRALSSDRTPGQSTLAGPPGATGGSFDVGPPGSHEPPLVPVAVAVQPFRADVESLFATPGSYW